MPDKLHNTAKHVLIGVTALLLVSACELPDTSKTSKADATTEDVGAAPDASENSSDASTTTVPKGSRGPQTLEAALPETIQRFVHIDGAQSTSWPLWRSLHDNFNLPWIQTGALGQLTREDLNGMGLDPDGQVAFVEHEGAVALIATSIGGDKPTASMTAWFKRQRKVDVTPEDRTIETTKVTVLLPVGGQQGTTKALLMMWHGRVVVWIGDQTTDPVAAATSWLKAASTPRLLVYPPYAISRLRSGLASSGVRGYVSASSSPKQDATTIAEMTHSVRAWTWTIAQGEAGALELKAVALQSTKGRQATQSMLVPQAETRWSLADAKTSLALPSLMWLSTQPELLHRWIPDLYAALAVPNESDANALRREPTPALQLRMSELTGRLVSGMKKASSLSNKPLQRQNPTVHNGFIGVELTDVDLGRAWLDALSGTLRAPLERVSMDRFAFRSGFRAEPFAHVCLVGSWLVVAHPEQSAICKTAAPSNAPETRLTPSFVGAKLAPNAPVEAFAGFGALGPLMATHLPKATTSWTVKPHELGFALDAIVASQTTSKEVFKQ